MSVRKIIHIDMDAFYASVEQRDNPGLRGKPVAVGGGAERGVVAAASYDARAFGVRSAMPGSLARRKCPELIFVRPRFDVYHQVSQKIRGIFHEYTHLVEPLSLDEAYLDVTHPLKGKNSATIIANEIRRRIWEEMHLTSSAGISYNKFLAKIASDVNKPNGFFVIHPDNAAEFIEKLPIERFHGVGKVTAEKFKQLGIHNGYDLKKAGLEFVARNFGKNGQFFFDIANGVDNRAVEPDRDRKSVGAENTFSTDLITENDLNREIKEICDTLFERLQKAVVRGKTLTVKIKYNDFTQITRSKSFAMGIHSRDDMEKIACEMLHAHRQPDKPIRLLGVSFSNLEIIGFRPGKQLRLNF